jgi:nicotinate-nucleotide adenylyltransferase
VARRSEFATWSFSTIPNAEPVAITGILGGTFDPVHRGHISAATQLLGRAGLTEVWLMPNARPPHRTMPPVASAIDRLAMVELAVEGLHAIRASALEVERGGVSYTIETIRELRAADPDRRFTLLLGADAALQIRAWHQSEALLSESSFVVFSRPPVAFDPGQLEQLGFPPGRTRQITIETPAISARTIRDRFRHGQAVGEMIAPAVAAYIRDHALYPAFGGMG